MRAQPSQPKDPDALYQGYGKNLYKMTGAEQTDSLLDVLDADLNATNAQNVSVSPSDMGSGVSTGTTQTAVGNMQGGKTMFNNSQTGYILGVDPTDGLAKLYIGNAISYLDWDGANILIAGNSVINGGLTMQGTLQVARYLVANLPDIFASTGANDTSIGTVVWDNPTNAKKFTGIIASTSDTSGNPVVSNYLKVTNFGYTVPSTSIILGIQVDIIQVKRSATSAVDNSIKVVKSNGTFSSKDESRGPSVQWSSDGNGTTVSYGGSTDLWGESWAPSDINNTNFGAVISCAYTNTIAGGGPGVALIRVIVYYTGQVTPVSMGSVAFAINGLKTGETAGNGSGLLVIHDGRTWKCSDRSATTVTA